MVVAGANIDANSHTGSAAMAGMVTSGRDSGGAKRGGGRPAGTKEGGLSDDIPSEEEKDDVIEIEVDAQAFDRRTDPAVSKHLRKKGIGK